MRYGLALTVMLCMTGVVSTQRQNELQSLIANLFPGQYWIEIDGALSNEGVMTNRVTEPGINNLRQTRWPFTIGDPSLSDPDQNDYGLGIDATIHDPEINDELTWAELGFSFNNILGLSPQRYDILSRETVEELSEVTPQVFAYILLPHRNIERFQFTYGVEGEVYIEERIHDDVFDRLIAFDFTAQNELNQEVHVRGAVYSRRIQEWIAETPSREVALALSGVIAADGTDELDIRRLPNEDGTLTFIFESEFMGNQRTAPDDEVPFTFIAEATLNEPEVCEPAYAQLTSQYGTTSLIVDDEPFEIENSIAEPPVISLCYEDIDHSTVSGIIGFREFAPDKLDEYIDFFLYFRAIPINP